MSAADNVNTNVLRHLSDDVRSSIIADGLTVGSVATTSSAEAAYVCWSTSPSSAWSLSGAIVGEPGAEWDLWQTWRSTAPNVVDLPGPTEAHEVRTGPIPASNLWMVGSRRCDTPDTPEAPWACVALGTPPCYPNADPALVPSTLHRGCGPATRPAPPAPTASDEPSGFIPALADALGWGESARPSTPSEADGPR